MECRRTLRSLQPCAPDQLTEEIDPALSPDGEQLAFVYKNSSDEDFDLYIKQVGGESPLQLTNTPGDERSPTWSPDGLYISFVRTAEAGHTIHVIPSLGGSERQLADFGEREVQGLAWSPADSTMAVSARRVPYGVFSLYLLSVDTNQLRELTIPPHYYYGDIAPAFSSDGQQIAFVRGIIEPVQDVYRVSVDGGQPVRLTSDNVQVTGLSWMSDDRHLIFASARDGNSGLRRIARSGGAPDWIAAAGDNASLNQPSMVRESDRLAYARYASDTNIWILERSRQPRRLIHTTRWESNADISPDGKRIAFISNQSGGYAVWICDRDGMNPIQLTSMDNVFLSTPRWSTDGSKIAFVTWKEGSADIYMVEAIGGTPRRVSRSPYDEIAPSWSQDGNWIYYASNQSQDWQIWKMPEAGDSISVQVTWDGGLAAFEAEDGDLFWVRPHEPGIWHRKAEADSIVKVVDSLVPEDGGNWAVRGKGIYYLERKANRDYIYYYSLTSRQTTQIAVLDRVPEHPNLAVAPDGKWFLYSQLEEIESDILLIDNLP